MRRLRVYAETTPLQSDRDTFIAAELAIRRLRAAMREAYDVAKTGGDCEKCAVIAEITSTWL